MTDLAVETYNSTFFDTVEEEREYYAVSGTIPLMGSREHRSYLFEYKFDSSCEAEVGDECPCIRIQREDKAWDCRYNATGIWSKIMSLPDSELMTNIEVSAYI